MKKSLTLAIVLCLLALEIATACTYAYLQVGVTTDEEQPIFPTEKIRTKTFFNRAFEYEAGGSLTLNKLGGTCQLSSTYKYEGSKSLLCQTGLGPCSKAFRTYNLGALYTDLYMQAKVLITTYPPAADVEGLRILQAENATGGPVSAMTYTTAGGVHCWGVRHWNQVEWVTHWNERATYTANTWYTVELRETPTEFYLWVNGVLVVSETETLVNSNGFDGVSLGLIYEMSSLSVYIDNFIVSTSYIGDTTGVYPLGSDYYYSGVTDLWQNNTYMLQYPSVHGDYLFTVLSHGGSGPESTADAKVVKRDKDTLANLGEVTLYNGEYECFMPQVYGDYLYIPAIGPLYPTHNSSITILRTDTLEQVAFINLGNTSSTCFIQIVIDESRGYMLIGTDPVANYGFYRVPLGQTLNQAAYQFVKVASNPDGGPNGGELQIALFNGKIYALTTSPCHGGSIEFRTRLYSSSDMSSWTLEFEKFGNNTGTGAYFAHLTASSDYLFAGVLTDYESAGKTTQSVFYGLNKTGSWQTLNVGIVEIQAEDHPNINALSSDIFLIEPTARQGSNTVENHLIYAFNATSRVLTLLLAGGTNGYSSGFNDRWVGIDVDNKMLYIADNYDYQDGWGSPHSSVIRISWNLALSIPMYLNPEPTTKPVRILTEPP